MTKPQLRMLIGGLMGLTSVAWFLAGSWVLGVGWAVLAAATIGEAVRSGR